MTDSVSGRFPGAGECIFELAQGDTDRTAVDEVWRDNQYKLDRHTVRGKTVVDIGANVGAFSVLAAKLGAVSVLAIEPHPLTCEALRGNIRRNGVDDRVTVIEAALCSDGGRHDVMLTGSGGGAHVTRDAQSSEESFPYLVQTVDVSMLPAEIDFMKIDCEGCEFDIIPALDLSRIERITMEFHGPVMPHLAHLEGAPQFGALVATLADAGRVETFGHPSRGGLIWWRRY